MFAIQLIWKDTVVTVQRYIATREEAEWAVAQWRQDYRCFGDPFRVVQTHFPEVVDSDGGGVFVKAGGS